MILEKIRKVTKHGAKLTIDPSTDSGLTSDISKEGEELLRGLAKKALFDGIESQFISGGLVEGKA